MAGMALRSFEVAGSMPISQRLRNFVSENTKDRNDTKSLKTILALYYGAHCAIPIKGVIEIEFRLDWNAPMSYNLFINGSAWNILDVNDIYLVDYLFASGMATSFIFRKHSANLPRIFRKYSDSFCKEMKMEIPLTKKTLKNFRIWSLLHDYKDFKVNTDIVRAVYGFTGYPFMPPTKDDLVFFLKTIKTPYAKF